MLHPYRTPCDVTNLIYGLHCLNDIWGVFSHFLNYFLYNVHIKYVNIISFRLKPLIKTQIFSNVVKMIN